MKEYPDRIPLYIQMSTKKGAAKKKNVEEPATEELNLATITPEELVEKVKDNAEEQEKSFAKLQEEFVTITASKNKLQGELKEVGKKLEHNVSLMRAWHNAFKTNAEGADNVDDEQEKGDDNIIEEKPAKKQIKKPTKKAEPDPVEEQAEEPEEQDEKKVAKKAPVKKAVQPEAETKPVPKKAVKKPVEDPVENDEEVEDKPVPKKVVAKKGTTKK